MRAHPWRLASLLTLLVVCDAVSAGTATALPLPFRLVAPYMLVTVQVNGNHRAVFCLDTASSVTLISPRLAEHLAMPAGKTRTIVTHTGAERMPQGVLMSLEVGPLKVTDLRVVVAKLSPITSVAPDVEGVIGQDVFGAVNYLVDYPRGVIEFDRGHRLVHALVGATVPAVRVGRRLLVQATLRVTAAAQAVPMLLALDSAASALMVFRRDTPDEAALQLAGRTKAVWVHSVEGDKLGLKGVAEQLAVGSQVLHRVPITVLEVPAGWQDQGQHGLLPTSAFDSIYFDNEGHGVMLNPQRLERTVAIDDDSDAGSNEARELRPPAP